MHLTEDGQTYLLAAQGALDELREAEQQLASRRVEPAGRVRIDLPAGFGRLLLPSFIELRAQFPRLSFELGLTDRMSDPVGEGWDVVVRIGALPEDSEFTVRKLCDLRLGLYASSAYLARTGDVKTSADLLGHDAIISLGQKMAAKTRAVVNHLAEVLQKADR